MNLKHPLESAFNMRGGSLDSDTEEQYELQEVPLTPSAGAPTPDVKDEDDILVEKRIDEVYDAAMTAFQTQSAYTEIIEPRYAARNAEVAANYLNIALSAVNSRARVKTDRKRANQFIPHAPGGKTTNNIVIANREEILKMITIDAEEKKV